jgi:hypothetical protein
MAEDMKRGLHTPYLPEKTITSEMKVKVITLCRAVSLILKGEEMRLAIPVVCV